MLLSLSHKFIFVANLKSASSSIERALAPFAEFKATKTPWGKHDDLSTISKKFKWIRKHMPFEEFFVFGVIRDPVDFILSLYNFHTRPGFDGRKHSSNGVTFEDFWHNWCSKSWQARPQHRRFIDRYGHFKISHIVLMSELTAEFPQICSKLRLNANLPKLNVSPVLLSRADLTAEQVSEIKERYAEDYAFIDTRPRAL
jgi:sulfotransferase famil protein